MIQLRLLRVPGCMRAAGSRGSAGPSIRSCCALLMKPRIQALFLLLSLAASECLPKPVVMRNCEGQSNRHHIVELGHTCDRFADRMDVGHVKQHVTRSEPRQSEEGRFELGNSLPAAFRRRHSFNGSGSRDRVAGEEYAGTTAIARGCIPGNSPMLGAGGH